MSGADETLWLRGELQPPADPMREKRAESGVASLVVVFVVLWTAASAAAVGITLWQISLAVRAATWPVAAGTILASRVEVSGDEARPCVEYAFDAAGHTWRGDTVHPLMSSRIEPARKCVARYAVGSAVTVRYLKHNPRVSMLEPGVQQADFAVLMMVTPFALVSTALVIAAIILIQSRRARPLARFGAIDIDRIDGAVVFRLRTRRMPSLIGFGLGAFAGMPLAFPLLIFWHDAPLGVYISTWIAQIGIVFVLWAWKRREFRRGDWIMAVDAVHREIAVARGLNRRNRALAAGCVVPFDAVSRIGLRECPGDGKSTFRTVAELQDGNAAVLADWMEEGEAVALGEWFAGVIGVERTGVLRV